MLGHRLNPTIHRYEDVELIEVHSEYLECSFLVAKDEWETGKKLLNIFSPIDGNVLGFPHYRLHRDNISATGPKLPDGTTAQPGMAEAIEIQRQAGHAIIIAVRMVDVDELGAKVTIHVIRHAAHCPQVH